MYQIKDWTGQKVNYFTVLELAPNYAAEHNIKNHHRYWKCQCICGKICYIDSGKLRMGNCKSCGCMRSNKNNLAGKTFGRLTVIDQNKEQTLKHSFKNNGDRRIYWNCKCNFCGTNTVRSSQSLLKNNQICCDNCKQIKNIIGEKNGKLTVIEFLGIDQTHNGIWKCQCQCGNTKILNTCLFRQVYSCGCMRESIGEYNIRKILEQNNIKYLYNTGSIFPDLISVKGYHKCRYDFIILNDNNKPIRLIEFDGTQHTDPNTAWYNTTMVANDKIKNEYAIKNNIPLVRIPFSLRDKITLDDIMGDKYLINKDKDKITKVLEDEKTMYDFYDDFDYNDVFRMRQQ